MEAEMSEQWLAWKTEGVKEEKPEIDFNGKWKNLLGSEMEIQVHQEQISGHYRTAVGAPGQYEKFPLTGFANGDLISFVVSWEKYGSITAWVGQHARDQDGKNERIETVWYMAKNIGGQSEPGTLWGTFLTGPNTFKRA